MSFNSGWAFWISAKRAVTASATDVSLYPLARDMEKPTTGLPSRRAKPRSSEGPSSSVAISRSGIHRPPGSEIVNRARSSTVLALAMVRTDCSRSPILPRPLGTLTFRSRSAVLIWSAETPSACSRSGFREMRISRLTPPSRCTFCTPGTVSSSRVIVSSTNHDKSTGETCDAETI